MRLTPVLKGPPVFHFWKDFGAGKKRRIPYYKYWRDQWRYRIAREQVKDYTIPQEQLPPNSTLMEAEDFLKAPLDMMPAQILERKHDNVLIDHPWPFDVKLDPIRNQVPMYNYAIDTRFFVPRADALVLTNTILETDQMEAEPPFEPNEEHLDYITRQYDWITKGDSVLVRLPRKRQFPKINLKPRPTYGITKERQEMHMLNSMMDFSQNLLAQYLYQSNEQDRLEQVLYRSSLAFPRCQVMLKRQDKDINLNLTIDSLTLNKSPLPPINPNPDTTRARPPLEIKPRTWRSILEPSRNYVADWSFALPKESHLHTVQLASRILRAHRDSDEMLARSLVHAFGLGTQFVRFKGEQNNTEHLPLTLQVIGLDQDMKEFHFVRYQLNTLELDDDNDERIKNQAWYSGPVKDLREALRYYIDFQAFDCSTDVGRVIKTQGDKRLEAQ